MSRVAWRWSMIYHWPQVCKITMGSHPHFISRRLSLDFGGIWTRTRTLGGEHECRDICNQMRTYIGEVVQKRMTVKDALDMFETLQPKGLESHDAS